jgi:hypothetical protein
VGLMIKMSVGEALEIASHPGRPEYARAHLEKALHVILTQAIPQTYVDRVSVGVQPMDMERLMIVGRER